MNGWAQAAALISAIAYIAAAPLEMFLYGRPWVRRLLHVETSHVADVQMWAFVVGFRNLLAGAGTLVGLVVLHTGDQTVGRTITLTGCAYMLLASLAMGLADLLGYWRPRRGSIPGTVGSSIPALAALLLALI